MTDKQKGVLEFYWHSRNYEKLKDETLKALESDPSDSIALTYLVMAYYSLNLDGKYNQEFLSACEEGLRCVSHPIDRGIIFERLAGNASSSGDYVKAMLYIEEALTLNPNNAGYMANQARNLAYLGDFKEFEALIKHALSLAPDDFYVLSCKYDVYLDFYNDKETEKLLIEQMLPLSTDPFYMHQCIANFHNKYGEYDEAYEAYVQALLIVPDSQILREKIIELERIKELEFLLKSLEKDLSPKNVSSIMALWEEAVRNNNYFKLNDLYLHYGGDAMLKNPGFAHIFAASAYLSDFFGACISRCEKASKRGTTTGHAEFYWGMSHYYRHEYIIGLYHLKKALEFNPWIETYHTYYFRCLAKMGKIDEALEYIEGNPRINRGNLEMLHALYITLYEFSDDFIKELESLEKLESCMKAYKKGYLWPISLYRAMTYEKYEDYEKAIKALSITLRFDYDTSKVKSRIEKRRKYGRTSIFSIPKRTKAGRQTYPLPTWKYL